MTAPIAASLSAAAEIRAELGRQDITRLDLARRLGVERMWIHNRLNGVTPFRIDDLQRIADALGVPLSSLIPTDDTPAEVTN